MKNIIDLLQEKNLLFKSLKPIEPKALGSRKKIEIYLGVDLKKYYNCIFFIKKKSRILRKEAEEIMELHSKLESHQDTAIKKKFIFIEAPLCSKAKALLVEKGWRVTELP